MVKTNEILWKVESIIRGEVQAERIIHLILSNAYRYACVNNLIYHKNDYLLDQSKHMNEHISEGIISKINELLDDLGLDGIRELVYELLFGKSYGKISPIQNSNKFISDLAYELLEMEGEGNVVFDLGSGIGSFLANVYKKSQDKKIILKNLIGVEINAEQANLSQMALLLLSDGSVCPRIINSDGLDGDNYVFNKGYSFPPLGMRSLFNEKRRSYISDIYFSNSNSAEWVFIDSLLMGLRDSNPGSRAIAIVSGRALFNNSDLIYRNMLLKKGRLEGIIELPAGALSFTGIKAFMLVFSNNDNKEVRFVDASNVVSAENRRYVNFELPVKTIKEMYYSKDVKKKTISELINVTNLTPSTIVLDTLDIKKMENGVVLKDVAGVLLGNQYTRSIFDNKGLLSDKKTGYRILTSSDIEDGAVNWENLQSINYKDTKFDKFAVKYGDVVVTSKSSKVKTVVVDIEPKEKILVTGGMLIIRPDQTKLNPTYLKMFLDSDEGKSALKSIQKGVTILTISASSLSTIVVPLIDMKKQEEKAYKYNARLSTLIAYRKEIQRIENSLTNLLKEEEED